MTRANDFWSRRKAEVAREAEREDERRAEAEAAEARAALGERPDAEILAELGLPDPDLMQRGDDFAAFMNQAVPERLRRRALRRLWRSDPVLANLDGLNNYDTDFRHSDIPGIAVKTTYEVGKGFARTVLGAGDEATAEATPEDTPLPTAAPSAVAEQVTAEADTQEAINHTDANVHDDEDLAPEEDDYTPAPRRRMRFEYTG